MEENQNNGSTVCQEYLIKYAQTQKKKIKYSSEEERNKKIADLNEKYDDDFNSKGDIIKDIEIEKIDLEYTKQETLIYASQSKLKLQFRNERFNKTKEDKDENGQSFEPVKTTLDEELQKLQKTEEEIQEQSDKEEEKSQEQLDKEEEKRKKEENKKAKKEAKQKKKEQRQKEKDAKKAKKETAYVQGNAMSIASTVGKAKDKEIDAYQQLSNEKLKEYKNTIEEKAKQRGYEQAVKDIKKYNKQLEKQAKNIFNKQKKNESKAKVKAKAAIQKAKLQIAAMLGL